MSEAAPCDARTTWLPCLEAGPEVACGATERDYEKCKWLGPMHTTHRPQRREGGLNETCWVKQTTDLRCCPGLQAAATHACETCHDLATL